MIERHQDYILTVPSVPVGGVQQVPLDLDTDAPFALRLVRSRNIEVFNNPVYNGWRFTNRGRLTNRTISGRTKLFPCCPEALFSHPAVR